MNDSTALDLALPDTIEQRLGAPRPIVLVLGSTYEEATAPTLDRLGCRRITTTTANAMDVASGLGNFSFVFIEPDTIGDEDGVYLIRDLHALSPNAKIVLTGAASSLDSKVLVEAMRAGVSDVVDPTDAIALSTTVDNSLVAADARAERVLAIGAHPDDVEIGCAGALLDHRRRGDSVSVLTMSHGQVGGDVSQRVQESTATAQTIGARLMLANLPDTRIDSGVDTIQMIECVVQAFDPTIIYVHSKNDNHQDHRAVHIATISASRRVPQIFAYQSPSATNDFAPTKFVAIDEVVVRKVEVLSLFDSQRERSYLEPEMVIAGARYWARNLAPRARYAEPFEVIRSMSAPPTRSAKPVTAAAPLAPVMPINDGQKVPT
ncbi:LmbE family N-acetylglucosaminyl deacetylase [Antricoccus suffuscus]|uniref:LmbE family N-acetylglucosaminyl deacetylase n=1 Tax=Antricoccus suffuscus TaxID=1629062 RepID=A0A2T1A5Z9_9ACTN|nr:PIG-L family deacetylase [Antricoccus suffuscus]PRZ44035.1 LmbE family N-acetylglucosaminyl deacetylase [Antricoccus suffuscus]